ncbi:hypothetical protein [Streptomyces roseolilacinus]
MGRADVHGVASGSFVSRTDGPRGGPGIVDDPDGEEWAGDRQ